MLFYILKELKPIFGFPVELLALVFQAGLTAFGKIGGGALQGLRISLVILVVLMNLSFFFNLDEFFLREDQGTLLASGLLVNYLALCTILAIKKALTPPKTIPHSPAE